MRVGEAVIDDPKFRAAAHRRIGAQLVYEAKLKEHEAACWVDTHVDEMRANLHSALDAVLDAIQEQIVTCKANMGKS
jgi:hypothetical protein